MSNANAALTVFNTPLEIAAAVRRIQVIGYGMNGLSVAWKDGNSSSEVTGYYRAGGRMKRWGGLDCQWNEIFEMLSGWGFFAVPDIGRILIAGPLADWIATALANAAIFGDMSAIGMGLYSVGISRRGIQVCEEALKNGKCILLLIGPSQEVKKAKQVIEECCGPDAA